MSDYVYGSDLIKRLNIEAFELFDCVKKGLQPLDKFGRPIPPPDISRKLAQLKELNGEHEKFLQEFSEIPSKFGELQKIPEIRHTMIMGLIELRERKTPRHEYVLNQIQILQQELDQITDRHSWANYELLEDEQSAQWVIDLLLKSLFNSENIFHSNVLIKKEFISGEELLKRWKKADWELLKFINKDVLHPFHRALLQPYIFKTVPYYESTKNPLRIKHDEFLTILPQSLFLLKEVEATEKANAELLSATNEPEYISGKELLKRWAIEKGQLLEIIRGGYCVAHKMFPSMDKVYLEQGKPRPYYFRVWHPAYEIIIVNSLEDGYGQRNPTLVETGKIPFVVNDVKELFYYLEELLFLKEQVDDVEKARPELCQKNETVQINHLHHNGKNRQSQIHKKEVRKLAEQMWSKDQSLTIKAIIDSDEINNATEPKMYAEKTLREWVKDLAPNRKPGRRPKKTSS